MSSLDQVHSDETQLELGELLQKMKGDGSERRFGKFSLTRPDAEKLLLTAGEKSLDLSNFEYVIVWALMSVSRPGTKEGGMLKPRDLDKVLSGILRESLPKADKLVKNENTIVKPNGLPENWKDEEDVAHKGHIASTQALVQRLRDKLSDAFGEQLTIENGGSNRGYFLKSGS